MGTSTQHRDPRPADPLVPETDQPPLDPEWADGAAIIAAELGANLTVIDTVARSMPGADENTSTAMGALINAADKIRAGPAEPWH